METMDLLQFGVEVFFSLWAAVLLTVIVVKGTRSHD